MKNNRSTVPNWKMVKLGEVTEIIKGGTPSRNVEKYFQGKIAWAIPSDITALDSALYIDDTETHITEEALNNSAAILLPVGTVLLTSRATIGDTAINTVPMATNQGFANFVCYENLSNVFLAYYLIPFLINYIPFATFVRYSVFVILAIFVSVYFFNISVSLSCISLIEVNTLSNNLALMSCQSLSIGFNSGL